MPVLNRSRTPPDLLHSSDTYSSMLEWLFTSISFAFFALTDYNAPRLNRGKAVLAMVDIKDAE